MTSENILDRLRRDLARSKRRRLGEIAVGRGWITSDQLKNSLELQKSDPRRLGQILVSEKQITEEQLRELLCEQGHGLLESLSGDTPAELPSDAKRLDQYALAEKLAAGGMGEVWKAWDGDLNRWVAVKILKAGSREAAQRFLREAKIAGRLNHPNIVAVHGVGEGYIAMQLVDGAPAGSGPTSIRRAAEIVQEAARAVQHAHDNGIIHRDLKPGNILVGGNGRVSVADFGIARAVASEGGITFAGTVLGTPSYMSPEQARGDPEKITRASDVFSLGATLYDLVTGRPPYDGPTTNELLVRAMECNPLPPRAVNPKLHRDLETIVMKAMDGEPARRYASAGALADDLQRFLDGEAIHARPPSVFGRLARKAARNPWAWALGLLLVAAILSFLVVERSQSLEEKAGELVVRAERRYAEGKIDDARSLAKEALKHVPDHPEARFWLARVAVRRYLLLRGVPDARVVRGIVEVMPARSRSAEEARLFSEIEDRLRGFQHRPMAAGMQALLAGKYGEAAEAFSKVPGDRPGAHEAEVYSAVAHYLLGQFEDAEARLERRREGDLDLFLQIRARTLLARAQEWIQSGAVEEAERRFILARGCAVRLRGHVGRVLHARVLTEWARMSAGFGKDPEDDYRKAADLVSTTDTPEALETKGDALLALAKHLANRGKVDPENPAAFHAAIDAYSKSIELDPKFGPAYMRRAEARYSTSDFHSTFGLKSETLLAGAIKDYEGALRINPDYTDAALGLARARTTYEIGTRATKEKVLPSYARLIAEQKRICNARMEYLPSHLALGDALLRLGIYQFSFGEEPWQALEEAEQTVEGILERNPDDFAARVLRGRIRVRRAGYRFRSGGDARSELQDGLADFQAALSLNPKSVKTLQFRANTHARLAMDFQLKGKNGQPFFDQAMADFDAAIRLNPSDPDLLRSRAHSRVGFGNLLLRTPRQDESYYEEALQDCVEAIRLNPRHKHAHLTAGLAYGILANFRRNKGEDPTPKFAMSIQCLDHVLKLDPGDVEGLEANANVRGNLARYQESRGIRPVPQWKAVVRLFDRSIAVNPKHPHAHVSQGAAIQNLARWLWTHESRDPLPEYQKALTSYGRAIDLRPRDTKGLKYRANLHSVVARLLQSMGRDPVPSYQAALKDADRLIALEPRSHLPLRTRGTIRMNLAIGQAESGGNPEAEFRKAIDDLSAALKIRPGDSGCLTRRGKSRIRFGAWLDQKGKQGEPYFWKALQDVNEALKRLPANPTVLHLSGSAKLHLALTTRDPKSRERFLQSAARDLTSALSRQSGLSEAHLDRGIVHSLLGNKEPALEDLNQAVKLDPSLKNRADPWIRKLR